jgi:hypothetical protein
MHQPENIPEQIRIIGILFKLDELDVENIHVLGGLCQKFI